MRKTILALALLLALPAAAQQKFSLFDSIRPVGASVPAVNGTLYYTCSVSPPRICPIAPGTVGQTLIYDAGGIPAPGNVSGSGTVTTVNTGTGLGGGPITSSGTIYLVVPVTVANGGSGLTTLPIGRIPFGAGTSPFATDSGFVFDGTNHRLLKVRRCQPGGAPVLAVP